MKINFTPVFKHFEHKSNATEKIVIVKKPEPIKEPVPPKTKKLDKFM